MLARGFKTFCENVALQVRHDLGLAKTDPLAPKALARHLGVLVWEPSEIEGLSHTSRAVLLGHDKDSWSAVTVSWAGTDAVIYNPTHSNARQSSDIMHELAHLLVSHEPTRMLLSQNGLIVLRSYDQNQEDEAAWLSGCLLLPREVLLFITRSQLSDLEAYARYGVSRELLAFRMNVTGVNFQTQRSRRGK